jgi:hypothetical protein
MRVSFDSNTWEKVFDPVDRDWVPIRSAVSSGRITGFICEAAFRIEAIRKRERTAYFAEPAMDVQLPFSTVIINGKPYVQLMSFGPDDASHPGLPEEGGQHRLFGNRSDHAIVHHRRRREAQPVGCSPNEIFYSGFVHGMNA